MIYTAIIISSIAGLVIGSLIGYFVRHFQLNREKKNQQSKIDNMMETARAKARDIELQARDEALRHRDEAEADISAVTLTVDQHARSPMLRHLTSIS